MEENKKSGLSTAGLVLGIVGICTSFIPIINNLSFVMGVLALVFGVIALVKKSGKGKNIAAIILGILAIVFTITSQKALSDGLDKIGKEFNEGMNEITGESTEKILKDYAKVELGNFEVIEDEYFDETEISVTVTNKTNEKKSFSFHIEATNEAGERIDEDYVYANDLGAGQTQTFKIFQFIEDEKIDAMKNSEFKIVEASMY